MHSLALGLIIGQNCSLCLHNSTNTGLEAEKEGGTAGHTGLEAEPDEPALSRDPQAALE